MYKQMLTIPLVATTLVLCAVAPVPPRPSTPMQPGGPSQRPEKKKVAEVGEEAPNFVLEDQHGETHTLKEYEGKIVVLEWFNDKCPVCNAVWSNGLMSTLIEDLSEMKTEVVYLAINSTGNKPKDEVFESGVEFLEEMEADIPMLMDYDGKVGHAYGARTTPHMFVIDAEGILMYQGALSDDRRMKKGADAETHVVRAINQIVDGKKVSPSYVQPWGCSVKYGKVLGRPGKPDRPSGRPMRPSKPGGTGDPR